MTVKKRFVDTDVFERDEPSIRVNLQNAIDQEKRISMRKDPHDFGDSEFVHYFLAGSGGAFGAAAGAVAAGFAGLASTRRMISVVMSATSCQ